MRPFLLLLHLRCARELRLTLPSPRHTAGFMMLGLLLIANLIIRPRKLKSHAPSLTATAPVQQQQPSLGAALRKIVRQPSAWLVCCGVFGVYVSCFIPLFYVGLFAREYSGPGPIATYAVRPLWSPPPRWLVTDTRVVERPHPQLSIINAVAFFSRIGSGIVADRLGVFNTALPLGALVAVLTFAMMAAHSTAALAVWLVLFGFAQGGWISVSAACFMSLADDASEIGCASPRDPLPPSLRGLTLTLLLPRSRQPPLRHRLLLRRARDPHRVPDRGRAPRRDGRELRRALCFGGGMAVAGCALLVLGRATQVRRRSSQWV